MITSKEDMLSDSQAITGTASSTDYIDLGAPGTVLGAPAAIRADLGKGNPVPLLIQITEDFTLLTSLEVLLWNDNDSNFGSPTVVARSEDIPLASLVAGFKVPLVWLPIGITERYLRARYVVTGSNPDAGKIWAGIVAAIQTNDRAAGA